MLGVRCTHRPGHRAVCKYIQPADAPSVLLHIICLQFRVLFNSTAAVCWTAFVITRTRTRTARRRSSLKWPPEFEVQARHIHLESAKLV